MDMHFWCSQCDERKWTPKSTIDSGFGGTGYAVTAYDSKVCYDCCARNDHEWMAAGKPITLYLVKRDGSWLVTDWPSGYGIKPSKVSRSDMRGFGGRPIPRYDVRFKHAGHCWHGVNQGDNQVLRCRTIKRLPW